MTNTKIQKSAQQKLADAITPLNRATDFIDEAYRMLDGKSETEAQRDALLEIDQLLNDAVSLQGDLQSILETYGD